MSYDLNIFVLMLYQLEMMKLNKYPFKILCPLEIKAPYTLKYFWMSELTKILINVCGVGRTRTKSLLPLCTRECSISVKCYVHKFFCFFVVLMYEFILAFTWIIYFITVFQIFLNWCTIFGVGHTSSEFN